MSATSSTQPQLEGLRFTLHLLGTYCYDPVHKAPLRELQALRFAWRVVARMLKQAVVFVVVGVTAK